MSASPFQAIPAASCRGEWASRTGSLKTWWAQSREAQLNWLALGLLLAAWNASDDNPAAPAQPRPEALRGYSYVSVRAAALHSERSASVCAHP